MKQMKVYLSGNWKLIILLMLYLRRFFSREKIGGANGMMALTITIGTIAGSIITGPIGEAIGYHWPLIISGIIAILAVVPAVIHRQLEKKHK